MNVNRQKLGMFSELLYATTIRVTDLIIVLNTTEQKKN